MPSQSLHVVAHDTIFFFLKETYYSVLWAHPWLICSLADRTAPSSCPSPPTAGVSHVPHIQLLRGLWESSKHEWANVSLTSSLNSFGYLTRGEIAGSFDNSI